MIRTRSRLAFLVVAVWVGSVLASPFERISFEGALDEAAPGQKLVLLSFTATWCLPCKKMDRVTWPDPRVQSWIAQHAVPVKVDADADIELAERFEVVSLPTVVVLTADGREVWRQVGFTDSAAFLEEAKKLTPVQMEAPIARGE